MCCEEGLIESYIILTGRNQKPHIISDVWKIIYPTGALNETVCFSSYVVLLIEFVMFFKQDLKEALAHVRICSRLEGLLLKKKSLASGDSPEVHTQKVQYALHLSICNLDQIYVNHIFSSYVRHTCVVDAFLLHILSVPAYF